MNKYILLSKNNFYSFILIIPLFILYQILGSINNYDSSLIVKNSADIYVKNFFYFFTLEYAEIIYLFFFIFIMSFIFFQNKDLFFSSEIRLSFLFGMILESLMHSISLLVSMSLISKTLPLGTGFLNSSLFENIYLSIGAGIWEEFLFRYVMISGLYFLLSKIMYNFSIYSYIIIIFFSSAIFSYYHFIGFNAEAVNLSLFIYRFLAGIILSIIFVFRGLGIAVYTHTFYDLYLALSQ